MPYFNHYRQVHPHPAEAGDRNSLWRCASYLTNLMLHAAFRAKRPHSSPTIPYRCTQTSLRMLYTHPNLVEVVREVTTFLLWIANRGCATRPLSANSISSDRLVANATPYGSRPKSQIGCLSINPDLSVHTCFGQVCLSPASF